MESGPYAYRFDDDSTGEWTIAYITMTKELSPRASLYVGDCVHNFRSALDHLACRLVEKAGKQIQRSTRFPVTRTRDEFDKEIAKALPGVSVTEWAAVEMLQPYHAATVDTQPLNLLQRLDIGDKHKSGLVAVAGILDTDIIKSHDGVEVVHGLTGDQFRYLSLNHASEICRVRKVADAPDGMGVQTKSRIDIVFGEDGPLAGKPVHEVLVSLGEFADRVIETFGRQSFS